ncbi:hypothetical protein J6590_031637 [Homalodisca vitripennis]|nr:hypothetical protein J6590_031637 [Homalodisca vitripennis]
MQLVPAQLLSSSVVQLVTQFNTEEILRALLVPQIPFKLTLRVWDVYLLEGEKVLTAMAYNILKMHRRNLTKRGMDDILQYLQVGLHQVHLEQNYEFEEDVTMESLQKCMEELRKAKLDYAGPPPSHELPKRPFGLFKEPAFEQKQVPISFIVFRAAVLITSCPRRVYCRTSSNSRVGQELIAPVMLMQASL